MSFKVPVPDYAFKILLGGAGGTGKSTFVKLYMDGIFVSDMKLTIGVEFHTKNLDISGKKVQFVIWDLGGQDRFKFLHERYIKGSRAGLIFFDMSHLNTLAQVRDWADMFRKFTTPDIPLFLIGTKKDLVDPVVQTGIDAAAQLIVDDLKLLTYVVTSSKENINVNETFGFLTTYLLERAGFVAKGA